MAQEYFYDIGNVCLLLVVVTFCVCTVMFFNKIINED